MRDIYDNSYPDLDDISEETKELDKITFATWLAQKFPNLHPHIRECLQLYCWSSFGGSITEISAAQGLNFVAAETPGVWTMPGGEQRLGPRNVEIHVGNSSNRVPASRFDRAEYSKECFELLDHL